MMLLDGFKILNAKWLVETFFITYGGGKGGRGRAPNFEPVAAATREAALYAKEAADADLAFRREQYETSLPYQRQLYDLASQVAQQQLGLGRLSEDQARQQLDSYNATYRPMELQTVLDSLGSQYLSDDEVRQAIQYLTDPRYDTTDVMGKRQKAIQDYEDETSTSVTETAGNNAAGTSQAGLGPWKFNPFTGWSRQEPEAAPTKTTTTTTRRKPVTRFEEEDFVAGQSKTLNKDFEQERASFMDRLAKRAQENAATRAGEGLQAQTNSAVGQQTRALSRMGLNTGRLQSNLAATAQNQALQNVNAQNTARNQMAAQQIGLRTGVANFGRNMPNTTGQAVATSAGVGSQAVGNQNTGFMSGLAFPQYVSGGVGNQLQAAQIRQQGALGLGSLQNQAFSIQNQNQDNFLGGALGLAGSLGSAMIMKPVGSDRSIKENIVKVGTLADGVYVYTFEYKPEYKDTWGHGGYVGVMADEVEKVMPEAVSVHADGYKQVNYAMLGL